MSRKLNPQNQKVLRNQGLVRKLIVARYGPAAGHDPDLNQAGLIGLCIAVESFERGQIVGRFSSYARTCIISELSKYSLASGRRLLPHRAFYQRISIQRHVTSLTQVLGREPSTEEILESWPPDSIAPTPAAVERALRPDPIVIADTGSDRIDDDADDSPAPSDAIGIEDLIDAKRRFERLSPLTQARLRGRRG